MLVYNTLTNKKEELKTIHPNEVRMYSCGPTVYSYAHIGNLRTYVFMDLLRRALSVDGYKLLGVMNITDVGHLTSDADEGEDKMEKAAKAQQKSPLEIAAYYTSIFKQDVAALNISLPEIVPNATDHIPEMIEFVKTLEDMGFAYETDDGIYFDIVAYGKYGVLSKLDLDEQLAGARVEVNDQKRHPADFALWKKAPKEHLQQWESPWGMGYPGWHIECSAMGRKYLGDTFDIHTGGVDHIPVHHENEIAQSTALLGHPAVNYWMHGEFMMVDNGKMSKSLGNTYTVADLKAKGIMPLTFRYFCLNAHYRNKINFTWDAIKASQKAYIRLLEAVSANKNAESDETCKELCEKAYADFMQAVNDDLNVPKALGILWNLLRSGKTSKEIFDTAVKMDAILGLDLANGVVPLEEENDIPQELLEKLALRTQARKEKNWALSDSLRDEINAAGYDIKDSAEGSTLVKR
ncbi:MAG: cysteine--tRNA ligase [Clostridia bacterium]|nr:cysteine--tRNA ligase [Clostridia bacterium]